MPFEFLITQIFSMLIGDFKVLGHVDLFQKNYKMFTQTFCFSLSRYKLKFSPDKVDTMIVQAICEFKKRFSVLNNIEPEINWFLMACNCKLYF